VSVLTILIYSVETKIPQRKAHKFSQEYFSEVGIEVKTEETMYMVMLSRQNAGQGPEYTDCL
jgi:hypothetical protein